MECDFDTLASCTKGLLGSERDFPQIQARAGMRLPPWSYLGTNLQTRKPIRINSSNILYGDRAIGFRHHRARDRHLEQWSPAYGPKRPYPTVNPGKQSSKANITPLEKPETLHP